MAVKLIHLNVYNATRQFQRWKRRPMPIVPCQLCGNSGSRWLVLFEGHQWEALMGFGRGALLWLLGVPLPIIILLALFWHH
jgi:hypothetical protein